MTTEAINLDTGLPRLSTCLKCGMPVDHESHNRSKPPPYGWHLFLSIDYLEGLEDALLFVREEKAAHQWKRTGITITTNPPFPEKRCAVCGGINWGGREDGICCGNRFAETAITAAHNRRAGRCWRQKQQEATTDDD